MGEEVRLVYHTTAVEVHPPDGLEVVHVKVGNGPQGVTFVGHVSDIHRLFVEVDKQVSRLVSRAAAE